MKHGAVARMAAKWVANDSKKGTILASLRREGLEFAAIRLTTVNGGHALSIELSHGACRVRVALYERRYKYCPNRHSANAASAR